MIDRVTDKEILSRLKAGDDKAFEQIFARWREPVLRFIDDIVNSPYDAEDICQETFVALWEKRETIDTSKNISTFIFLIAKQKIWKFFRKDRHTDDLYDATELDRNLDLSPEDILQEEEMRLLVDYAVNCLSPRTREIFNLHFTEGLSYEQIAERLDINTANVKVHIHQARTRIKDILLAIMIFLSL